MAGLRNLAVGAHHLAGRRDIKFRRAERVQASDCPVKSEEPATERYGLSDVRRGGTEKPPARPAQAARASL